MNELFLIGYVIKDPEVRTSPSNKTSVAHFPISIKRDCSKQKDYLTMIAFNKNALYIKKHIKKGMKVFIKAKVQNNNYEKDGIKHYEFDFIVKSIELMADNKG